MNKLRFNDFPDSRNTEVDKLPNKTLPASGYRWVPASTKPSWYSGITAYYAEHLDKDVPYGTYLTKLENSPAVARVLKTPSYSMIYTTASVKHLPRPPDAVVYPGREALSRIGFMLYGVADAPTMRKSIARDKLRSLGFVIQDSGGFQLAMGTEEFIDPVHVAAMHGMYADSGVALDIPTFGVGDRRLLVATAEVLNANNNILREATHKNARLMNIAHGSFLPLRKEFIKIATRDQKLDSLCIAGLRQTAMAKVKFTPLRFAAHVVFTILETKRSYPHYHVLGVATDWQMAILSLVAAKLKVFVTSDSASHTLSASAGALLNYGSPEQTFFRAPKTNESKGWVLNRCNCRVCVQTKYLRAYADVAATMFYHNAYAIHNQAELLSQLSEELLIEGKESRYIARSLANNTLAGTTKDKAHVQFMDSFNAAVDLVLTVKKADEVLTAVKEPTSTSSGLFAEQKSKTDRLVSLVHKYEAYHKKKFLK